MKQLQLAVLATGHSLNVTTHKLMTLSHFKHTGDWTGGLTSLLQALWTVPRIKQNYEIMLLVIL